MLLFCSFSMFSACWIFFPASCNLFEHKMISFYLNEIDNHYNKFILPYKWSNWQYSWTVHVAQRALQFGAMTSTWSPESVLRLENSNFFHSGEWLHVFYLYISFNLFIYRLTRIHFNLTHGKDIFSFLLKFSI